MKGSGIVSIVIVLTMVLMAARESRAVDCGQVVGALSPCLTYLKSGGSPSSQCCAGVRKLRDLTGNTQDRRSACQCVKDAASKVSVNPDNASKLPGLCGAPISIPISSSTNCQTIP